MPSCASSLGSQRGASKGLFWFAASGTARQMMFAARAAIITHIHNLGTQHNVCVCVCQSDACSATDPKVSSSRRDETWEPSWQLANVAKMKLCNKNNLFDAPNTTCACLIECLFRASDDVRAVHFPGRNKKKSNQLWSSCTCTTCERQR